MYRKCEPVKQNWMTSVKQLLQMYGFGDVWLDQNVTNKKEFIREFGTRIKDCKMQTWSAKIETVPKLKYHCMYMGNFELELYLLLNLPRKVKKQLSEYRIASHNLEVEKGRHFNLPREDRLCKLCGTNYNRQEIECEFHFLLQCPFYDSLWANCTSIVVDKTLLNSKNLMSWTEANHLTYLAFSFGNALSNNYCIIDIWILANVINVKANIGQRHFCSILSINKQTKVITIEIGYLPVHPDSNA